MSNDAPERTLSRCLRATLLGLFATVAGLGAPDLLSASETIFCNALPLIAAPPTARAQLGWAIATTKNDNGEWLAAGANQDNANAGSVSIYLNPGPGTPQTGLKIIPADLQLGDQFGSSVSMSGNWLAVGAPVGDGKVRDSGVAYLFQLDGSTWVQRVKLEAADATQRAKFGFSVSLSGKTLVVGAPDDSGRGSSAGAAYVFEIQGEVWKQTAKLLAGDGRAFDEFGSAVAIRGDENEIVIGAPFADDLTALRNFGAAYVYRRDSAARDGWTLEANGKLTAADTIQGDNIQFGAAVAIRGNRIVVGAPGGDLQGRDSGSAYVFERETLNWVRQPHPPAPEDPGQLEQFGSAVLIDDQDRIVIGARFDGEGGGSAGAAYRFERQSDGSWKQAQKFVRQEPGGAFGQSVATLGDQVFMGGFEYDVNVHSVQDVMFMDAGAVAVCPKGPQPCPSAPSVSRTDHQATVQPGQTVTFQIDVVAAPPGTSVSDTFPPELESVGWCRGANCTDFMQKDFLDTLPTGGNATYLVRGRVRADAAGKLTNKACVDLGGCPQACTSVTDTIQTTTPPLSCVKTGPGTAAPGGTVTYQVTVSNDGRQAAHGVTLNDPNPPNLHLVSASTPCSGGFPCNLGTIAAGRTLPPVGMTFKVDVPLDCAAPGPTVTNVATVGSAECRAQTRIVPPEADLALALVASNGPSVCGTSLSFSLTASNLGTAIARGAVLDVTAVGALSLTSNEPGCALVAGPQPHLLCTGLPDLRPGGPGHTIIFSAQAPACGPGCGAVTVNATVRSSNTCDRNPGNDTVTKLIPVTCPPAADLAITKRHEPAILAPGQAMAYILTVRNNGPTDVTGATISDSLPNALLGPQCVGANRSACTFSGGSLSIKVDLPVGSEETYRIEGNLPFQCIGILSNTATISPPSSVVDPDLSNNTATDTAAASPPPGVSVLCAGGNSMAFEGDAVTFTFVLLNGGPNAQADNPGAEFTNTLPAGLTLISAAASSGTVTTALNTVSWNGSIPVCGTVTINVQASVNLGTAGMTLCNQGIASFDADGNGTNESNASDSCCLRILTPPPVPTLSTTGLAALALLLGGLALLRLRRRSP
jgi:uncharacterized repeat protein (TIGR01451 family)